MIADNNDGRKWIYGGLALGCFFLFQILYRFFLQLGDWFELEVKIANFMIVAQMVAIAFSALAFLIVIKHKTSSRFLVETYNEMIKVVFPDRSETFRTTLVVMVLVTIVGFILGMFDMGAGWVLSQLPAFY